MLTIDSGQITDPITSFEQLTLSLYCRSTHSHFRAVFFKMVSFVGVVMNNQVERAANNRRLFLKIAIFGALLPAFFRQDTFLVIRGGWLVTKNDFT